MDEKLQDDQLAKWFSTYGLITAQRILDRYAIVLPQNELVDAIKSPFSFYHYLLKIPLKNILNGIVLQQASDYHVYVQKLFIDYLLSGESSKGEEDQGAMTRETLEGERQSLIALGEDFQELQLQHVDLITKSQMNLIKVAADWKQHFESVLTLMTALIKKHGFSSKKSQVRKALNHALIHCNYVKAVSLGNQYLLIDEFNKYLNLDLNQELKQRLLETMTEILEIILNFDSQFKLFMENANELGKLACSYRTQFYDTILRVTELIYLLPEYKIDMIQDAINRESLYFDKTIGDD